MELGTGHEGYGGFYAAAFNLGGPACHISEEVDGQLNVHSGGHSHGLAIVQALQFCQRLGIRFDQVREPPQQPFPFHRLHPAPGGILKGSACNPYGKVDIRCCSAGNPGQVVPIGWIDDVQELIAATLRTLVSNQQGMGPVDKCLGIRVQGKFSHNKPLRSLLLSLDG